MISKTPKKCSCIECNGYVWAKGMCKYHYNLNRLNMRNTEHKKGYIQKKAYIKPVSEKRKRESVEYNKRRKEYLLTFPKCLACICNMETVGINRSTDVHHAYRRSGRAYLDSSTWLPVCRECHERIETSPAWASFNGFIATQQQLTEYFKNNGKITTK